MATTKDVLHVVGKERILAVHEALVLKYGESPFDENWRNRPSQDHRVTTRLHIGDYLYARTQSLRAHATQVDPTAKFWFDLLMQNYLMCTRGKIGFWRRVIIVKFQKE